mgnify:CR=1 FL=1
MTDTDAPRGSAPGPAAPILSASSPAGSSQQGGAELGAVPARARKRWGELVRDIEAARDAYYNAVDAESPLSDADYDVLYRELEDLEAIDIDVVDLDTAMKAAVLRYGIDGTKTQLEWVAQTRRTIAADAGTTRSRATEGTETNDEDSH